MRVQELAERAGVSRHAVRYYDSLGLLHAARACCGEAPYHGWRRGRVMDAYGQVLRSVLLAFALCWALASQAAETTPGKLPATKTMPTTVMEKEMEALRRELNGLAAPMRRIHATPDPGVRRVLLREHLARLRENIVSLGVMEQRMHTALDHGQITSDSMARERHGILFEQMVMVVEMLAASVSEMQELGDRRR